MKNLTKNLMTFASVSLLAGVVNAAGGIQTKKSYTYVDYWTSEYPRGLSIQAPEGITVKAQRLLRLENSMLQDCLLPSNATYHPWNGERVKKDNLKFITKSENVKVPVEAEEGETKKIVLDSGSFDSDGNYQSKETIVEVKKGDKITYLNNLSEGYFRVKVKGKKGDTSDIPVSEASWAAISAAKEVQFVRVTCANDGKKRWVNVDKVLEEHGGDSNNARAIETPLMSYGEAYDLNVENN